MADYSSLFEDEDFTVEHLFASPENESLIQSFSVGNDAMGLVHLVQLDILQLPMTILT